MALLSQQFFINNSQNTYLYLVLKFIFMNQAVCEQFELSLGKNIFLFICFSKQTKHKPELKLDY